MDADSKDEELYLLCDDTDEHYALTHKEELEKQEKKYGTHSSEYLKKMIQKYSS